MKKVDKKIVDLMISDPEVVKDEVAAPSGCWLKDITRNIRKDCKDKESLILTLDSCYKDLKNLKTNFVLLGGHIHDLKWHITDIWSFKKGRYCKDIYEVAEHCFNFCKTTTKNLLSVAERFGAFWSTLKPEFEEYNYSQLCEMVTLTDEQLKLIKPEMTVKEIRDYKKSIEKVGQTSDQKTSSLMNKGIEAFLILKNDEQRRDFLRNYKFWKLCSEVKEYGLKFYEAELSNGDLLVVTENTMFLSKEDKNYDYYKKHLTNYTYRIIKKGTSPTLYSYSMYCMSDSEYLNYMKSNKVKIKTDGEYKDYEEYKQRKGEEKHV